MPQCLSCNADYIAGELYCNSCGRRLPQPTGAHPPARIAPELLEEDRKAAREDAQHDKDEPEKPPHLRLELVQYGVTFDLGDRESVLIGRKDPGQEPDVDLTPYGGVEQGVSRRHALITLKQGRYYIEDLKAINETLLNSSRLFPGQLYPLRDGDQLRFGTMVVKVLL